MMLLLAALALQAADAVDGYLSQLKSPSKERQEAARLALRAYGASIAERLQAAGLDPELVEPKGALDRDPAIAEKVNSLKITIDMENAPLGAIADELAKLSGIRIELDPRLTTLDDTYISIKMQDLVLDAALQLLLHPRNCKYVVRGGRVLITSRDGPPDLPSLWPVRVAAEHPDARRLVGDLASDLPDDRDRAQAALLRLGLAAESALWEGLDSKESEVRSRSALVLRALFTPRLAPLQPPLLKRLKSKEVRLNLKKASVGDSLRALAAALECPIVVHSEKALPDWTLTYGVPCSGSEALTMVARQFQLEVVPMDTWILLTKDPERILGTTEYGSTWTDPDEARKIESFLRRLTGEDPAKQEEARSELLQFRLAVLGPLLEASRVLPPPAARRCLEARARYVDENKLWLADEPSGFLLQNLDEDRKRFLDEAVDVSGVNLSLDEVVKKAGIPARIASGGDLRIHLWAKGMTRGTLLRAMTGPRGLDVRFDGGTALVDAAPEIRKSLAK